MHSLLTPIMCAWWTRRAWTTFGGFVLLLLRRTTSMCSLLMLYSQEVGITQLRPKARQISTLAFLKAVKKC